MRIRIKTIKVEMMSSSSTLVRHKLQKAHVNNESRPVKFRKDGFSVNLKKEE